MRIKYTDNSRDIGKCNSFLFRKMSKPSRPGKPIEWDKERWIYYFILMTL